MPERQHHAGIEKIAQEPLAQSANSAIVQQAVAQLAESCRRRNLTQPAAGVTDCSLLIGVAEWETKIVGALPDNLKGSLPTVEEIEAELAEYPRSAPRSPRRKR